MGKKATTAASRKLPGEIALVGIESSGKTLLCRHLELRTAAPEPDAKKKSKKSASVALAPELNTRTQPSIGVELIELKHRELAFDVRECGGTIQPVWPQYLEKSAAVIFLVDTASAEGCSGAAVELCDVLQSASERVLLFFNKRDAPSALPYETVRMLFNLDELMWLHAERLTVLSGSALSGDGLDAALDWCVDSLVEAERLEAEVRAHLEAKAAQQAANEKLSAEINAAAESGAPAPPANVTATAGAEAPKKRRMWGR